MGSGGVGEVPTIFHPRRSRTSNIALIEDQQTHGPFITPIQIALHASGKSARRCIDCVGPTLTPSPSLSFQSQILGEAEESDNPLITAVVNDYSRFWK